MSAKTKLVCHLSVGDLVEFNECPDSLEVRDGSVTRVESELNSFWVRPNDPSASNVELRFDIDGSSWCSEPDPYAGNVKFERTDKVFTYKTVRENRRSRTETVCHYCDEKGHTKRVCPELRKDKETQTFRR